MFRCLLRICVIAKVNWNTGANSIRKLRLSIDLGDYGKKWQVLDERAKPNQTEWGYAEEQFT